MVSSSRRVASRVELFERWFNDVMRHQIAPSTFSNYQTVVRMHVLPILGRKKLVELTVSDVDKLLSLRRTAVSPRPRCEGFELCWLSASTRRSGGNSFIGTSPRSLGHQR
jgi:hypothetical protein